MEDKFKRAIDVCLSLLCLIVLFPFLLIVALIVKLTSRGPVLYVQIRAGRGGKAFKMYKFRTMKYGSEATTLGRYISREDSSITSFGRFLRRWAIDELPQLVNVLRGDISIVGPRPTLGYQVERYSERQRRRLDVKPGITGWAQVNGRNKLNWPERIELDVWYVDNWSLKLDMKIILMTLPALLRRDFAFAGEECLTDEIVRHDT